MIYLYFALFVAISALLWRIRGGLWKEYISANKIWYGLFFALYGYFYFGTIQSAVIGFIACYTSYQLYGWGAYIGGLINGSPYDREKDAECELIDDLLYPLHITLKGQKYYLCQYPRLFGFCGTSLTGLIITFLWGLYLGSIAIMLCGIGMGICYWLGYLLNKLIPEGKAGWGYGEYITGIWFGLILAYHLLW